MRVLGGRYRLVEPVGSGGMAEVWRADDLLLRRTVAVKLLAPRLAADRASRELLRSEAYAAARLNHPHIANVYDYGEARLRGYRRLPYLVMEFVQGETLAARLRAGGPLPWPEAVRVVADVAVALAAAHAEGLVHRDVKPGNVLLSPRGVKVVDLGIALPIGKQSAGRHGEVLGTPRYMAPEQLRGEAAAPDSDMYALGLLLYECLTGEPLRRGASTAELLRQPPPETATLPTPIMPGLPDEVAQVCQRCLAPTPGDRPSSEYVAALLAQVAGLASPVRTPVRAEPDDAARTVRISRPVPRPVRSVSTAAAGPDRASRRRRPTRRQAFVAAVPTVAVAALLVAQLPGLTSTDDAAEGAGAAGTEGCVARYTARHVTDGTFTAALAVTNTGGRTLPDWSLSFSLPAGHRLTDGGPGVAQQGRTVTVTPDDPIAAAGTVTLDLSGTYDVTGGGAPTGFTVNGVSCERASTSVVSTPQTPVTDGVPNVTTEGGGDQVDTVDVAGETGGGGTPSPTPRATPTGSPTPGSPPATRTPPPPTGTPPPAEPTDPPTAEPTAEPEPSGPSNPVDPPDGGEPTPTAPVDDELDPT
ncbi:protein kinase [Plantactinospora sp. GCM10030261]|uniref:protein kinase domain-containing protein n=1 Tax=Plantactinospora sp. GCM10030261 TaxID=3273420 RepID=UPI0036079BAE